MPASIRVEDDRHALFCCNAQLCLLAPRNKFSVHMSSANQSILPAATDSEAARGLELNHLCMGS
jgi:hypothetical protein